MVEEQRAIEPCYLCGATNFVFRQGVVRDAPQLKIVECCNCTLVFLHPKFDNNAEHYADSGMHGSNVPSMEEWQRTTAFDDDRRFQNMRNVLTNKRILDFGCGNGGFLLRARSLAAKVSGLEPEKRVREYFDNSLEIESDLSTFVHRAEQFDLITAFHVIEHLPDPVDVLNQLKKVLAQKGRIVLEVPSAEDALLTLYGSGAFQRFTYWSQHLFLFNARTLKELALRAGLAVVGIEQYQRYPLSNHLYWLSKGRPGGHQVWSFIDSPALDEAYSAALAKTGKTDTLIAYLEHA